jgi:hypothetical protein
MRRRQWGGFRLTAQPGPTNDDPLIISPIHFPLLAAGSGATLRSSPGTGLQGDPARGPDFTRRRHPGGDEFQTGGENSPALSAFEAGDQDAPTPDEGQADYEGWGQGPRVSARPLATNEIFALFSGFSGCVSQLDGAARYAVGWIMAFFPLGKNTGMGKFGITFLASPVIEEKAVRVDSGVISGWGGGPAMPSSLWRRLFMRMHYRRPANRMTFIIAPRDKCRCS